MGVDGDRAGAAIRCDTVDREGIVGDEVELLRRGSRWEGSGKEGAYPWKR